MEIVHSGFGHTAHLLYHNELVFYLNCLPLILRLYDVRGLSKQIAEGRFIYD